MEQRIINGIRSLGLDMINEAKSGHPGVTLDAAPTLYALFSNHLNFSKDDPTWINRDRFILSAGHASALLYSTLLFSGYKITLEDLKLYRKKESFLGGNPELNQKIGIETTTGIPGEGLGNAIGIAVAEEYLRNLLGNELINFYTYVFVSEEDLMEGISYEAASLAGTLKLHKLIILYDSNKTTLDGKINGIFEENVLKRFEALGWNTDTVPSGEDYTLINKAIEKAKTSDLPTIIQINSIIGIGTKDAGTNKVHNIPLTEEDLYRVKEKMNISKVPFHISKEAVLSFREQIDKRVTPTYNEWVSRYNKIIETDETRRKILASLEGKTPKINLKNLQIHFEKDMKEDMRTTNANLMTVIGKLFPLFIGGNANTSKETKTYLEGLGDFKITSSTGKNIHFGVRERLMASVINGLALTGLKPFGSTLLTFSDYMKPSIRMTSIMNLPVTYIFTHDSINTENDAHQPIEQLGALRNIPNMTVFRPADVNELVGSWDYIINKNTPASLIIPKEEKGLLNSSIEGTTRGAYIIKKEEGRLSGIIIATGTEVETALEISKRLYLKGLSIRVVSMPSIELFNKEPIEYKQELLVMGAKTIVLEASNDSIWNEFVYNKKYILNIETFKTNETKEYNYNIDNLTEKIEKLLK